MSSKKPGFIDPNASWHAYTGCGTCLVATFIFWFILGAIWVAVT